MESGKIAENTCRICGTDEFTLACVKNGSRYVKCSGCDVIRQYPYPSKEETDSFYKKYLQIKNQENPVYMSDESWDNFKKVRDLTLQDLNFSPVKFKGEKVLDIGCATGLFVKYVNQYGASGYGIDVSSQLIEIAQKNGLNCHYKDLFEIDEKFDIINLSHVIEHVDDPIRYLEFIYSILNDNGVLFLETPCTGIISETFAENWRFYMPVEHIHLFSQECLFKILTDKEFMITGWIRFGSGNTTGTIDRISKNVADTIAKKLGIGDTISVLCRKRVQVDNLYLADN